MLYLTEVKKQLNSESDMKTWGEKVGALLGGGEFIELVGDVGAGKTTFTKGLAKGLGISDTVQSPTFTISRVYDADRGLKLAHYDFYRLNDAGIMADELAETSNDPNTIIVVEWGDVVGDVRPNDYLQFEISSPSETVREVVVNAHGSKSQKVLEQLA